MASISSSGESFLDSRRALFSSAFTVFLSVFSLPFPGFLFFFPIVFFNSSETEFTLCFESWQCGRRERLRKTRGLNDRIAATPFWFSQVSGVVYGRSFQGKIYPVKMQGNTQNILKYIY